MQYFTEMPNKSFNIDHFYIALRYTPHYVKQLIGDRPRFFSVFNCRKSGLSPLCFSLMIQMEHQQDGRTEQTRFECPVCGRNHLWVIGDRPWVIGDRPRFKSLVKTLGSSGISVGLFLALWYIPACGLVGNIPVTHRVHRLKRWIGGQHPCCPHIHSPINFCYSENKWR
jgi:hypothetical protein